MIILASQSPRRKQLLQWADIDFKVITVDTDEHFLPAHSPEAAVQYIAANKAAAAKKICSTGDVIIAADTIVVLENEIIGKPAGRQEAINMLTKLSGKMHEVITAVHISSPEGDIGFAETTKVFFNNLSTEQITYYIDTYKPYDKAGAYGIQDWIGVVGIKAIEGDFYNVMGLPVSRVVGYLKSLG